VAETFRPQIVDDDKQMLTRIIANKQQSEGTKQEVVKFHSQVEHAEKMIVTAGENIKRLVDNQVRECLGEL